MGSDRAFCDCCAQVGQFDGIKNPKTSGAPKVWSLPLISSGARAWSLGRRRKPSGPS